MSQQDVPWPPASPHEAHIISSPPSQRKRAALEAPLSPSPLRKSAKIPHVASSDEDEDEDEETLELKLAEIKAQLALKKVQKEKARKRKAAEIDALQVPKSPTPSPQKPPIHAQSPSRSPARVLLNLDRGLTGRDISLRKPPTQPDFTSKTPPRPLKTFNDRLAEAKEEERRRREREVLLKESRSKGFAPIARPVTPPTQTSRPTPVQQPGHEKVPVQMIGAVEEGRRAREAILAASFEFPQAKSQHQLQEADIVLEKPTGGILEPYSKQYLTKQLIDKEDLSEHFRGRTLFTIPDLLKTVTGPAFEAPDVVGDWILLGIIASKSDVRTASKGEQRKYLVLTLTDLKYDIEIFLFGPAFEKFWKVTRGTLIALLNPAVMKPRVSTAVTFSLNLSEPEDQLLEIGRSRDLGVCSAMKKDGGRCKMWVDLQKGEWCGFHVDMNLKKIRSGRMELAVSNEPRRGGGGGRGGRGGGGGGGGGGSYGGDARGTGLLPSDGGRADWVNKGTGAKTYVMPAAYASSHFFDDDPASTAARKAKLKKDLEDRKKELETMKKLAKVSGGGVGAEYMSIQSGEGVVVSPSQGEGSSGSAFSAQHVRRLGFDPTKRREGMYRAGGPPNVEGLLQGGVASGEVRLSPAKVKGKEVQKAVEESDSDDLEFV
ncbi:hypothetical protein SAICODRAFT_19449 [Saitoella complicata NRRL Y-17804]|uniref:Uncharacterized protein n=1 Tax=Saitoella complicata (strain BCRC 22490 / CBS 7301 / JCM 7358 / NBRC 10748 / NRRL Y-17804) TaxID=698492 RepID=A0A0E9NR63_SAICN|nr:uncharacterized protein SAICODRAFT_19449 [Saitoella complicata NRRL Y-17804]ODQ52644.1 hypothetical protein SAICODRAFT_19449 [Saitoella complicata NRRL Y-17804]GAO52354.1 hypothetical protein G7K_6432-t1 [Saitoella complicata NRRL Y-17804]